MTPNPDQYPSPPGLVDGFGRRLHYLRMSVTDRCNLRCIYCMPQEGLTKLPHAEILTLEELARVVAVAVDLGVDKIRLTGGEPLLRRDLGSLLAKLSALRPRPDLRLTTNGRLLDQNLPMLLEHGVSTVNISLDTLNSERYGAITGLEPREGQRAYAQAWEGVEAALASRRVTVKINVVLLAGINEDELANFARLTQIAPWRCAISSTCPWADTPASCPSAFWPPNSCWRCSRDWDA
ncbi:GTP 3',8-cyclase [Desulfarculales bacterium]